MSSPPSEPSQPGGIVSAHAAPGPAVFHPERLVAVLGRFKVRYVLVGSVAARLQGYPWLVAVAEIVPATDAPNLEALATALRHLGARISIDGIPDGIPFDLSAATLSRAASWDLLTSCGRLDVQLNVAGAASYDSLAANAVPYQLHGDLLFAAALDDIATMKEATGRPSEKHESAMIRALAHKSKQISAT